MKYYEDLRVAAHLQPLESEAKAERLAHAAGHRETVIGAIRMALLLARPVRIAILVGLILLAGMLAIQILTSTDSGETTATVDDPVEMLAPGAEPMPRCAVSDVPRCVD